MNAKKTSSEQLLVFMVRNQRQQAFVHWPLHVTIVPWFSVADDLEIKLDYALTTLAKNHQRIQAVIGHTETWGNHIVEVIAPNQQLHNFHLDVLMMLNQHNFVIHNAKYTGEVYRPHVTRQQEGRVHIGDILELHSFALIKQNKNVKTGEMVKTIVKEYKLL